MHIKLATWNMHYGMELPKMLETITTHTDFSDLDFLALQEASHHAGRDDALTIAQALGSEYDYFQVTAQTRRGMAQANAIIWNRKRITLTDKHAIALPTYKDAEIGRGEHTLKRLIRKENRGSVMIEGNIEGKTFRLYSVHCDVVGFSLKTAQLQHLFADNASRTPADFSCIAGDLNTFKILKRPTWESLTRIAGSYQFSDITSEIVWTFQRKAIRYRQKTDAIYLQNTHLQSFSSWSQNLSGSDHLPVFAIVEL